MAVIKHIAIKNSNYRAAIDYLTTQHDEFTSKPILDANGRRILREEFLLEGINCDPYSFDDVCVKTNAQFGKNTTQAEIKVYHYIISFDPRDRDENGLTPERAQAMGMDFARRNFPGHQILVCTHPDGHHSVGNIHVHIVLNSVRKLDVEWQDFMERPGDCLAGHKHHVSKNFLDYLKQQTMELCQQEQLNQVDLLSPPKVRISDREYWAQRLGQRELDERESTSSASESSKTKFETTQGWLRRVITETAKDSASFGEFETKLFANYGIVVRESRGQISYLLPDRVKPIRGKRLGTDYEKSSVLLLISQRRRTAQRLPLSIVGAITDVASNAKAQRSVNYADAIKKSNVQKMMDTVEFVQEHGFSIDDLPTLLASTSADFEAKRAAMKATEDQLHKLAPITQATRQYYKTKAVHSQYLKAGNKKKFREEHHADLAIYDAAVKELRAYYGEQKFKPIKELLATQAQLKATKNQQYEDYSFARSKLRELQNIDTNIRVIYSREPQREQEKEPSRS